MGHMTTCAALQNTSYSVTRPGAVGVRRVLLMNLHKATVSEQIQQLEDKLGTRLLTRTTRSVTPTVEGLAYYQRASAILQQIDATEAVLRKSSASPECPLAHHAQVGRRSASTGKTRPIRLIREG